MSAVYAWGANSHGQLGLGYESELCMTPERLSRFSFNVNAIRSIQGGGGHVVILDNCGRLHSCGWNNRGQLGIDSDLDHHNEFNRIPTEYFHDVAINSVACGWDISGAISADGKLYLWGSNSFQQLGICQRGFSAVRRPFPVVLPRGETPKRITFGLRHSAVLTADNKIYIFGRLRIEEVHPDLKITLTSLNRSNVTKIYSDVVQFVSMASGQNHLLIKVSNAHSDETKPIICNRVIGLGDNKYGQANSFQCDSEILRIVAGWTHNGILTKDNRVLLWGRNLYGQCGTGEASDSHRTPVQLKLPEGIIPHKLHLGSEHGMIRTADGEVFTWGWNEHGNCGNSSTENLYTPSLIKLAGSCKLAGVGAGFCYAVCDDSVFESKSENC